MPVPQRRSSTSYEEKQNLIDLTGRYFPTLTVVSLSHKQGRRYYWDCTCDCGAEHIKRAGDYLVSGKPVSCGCQRLAKIKDPQKVALSGRRDEYSVYKRSAAKRGLTFDLAFDTFVLLLKDVCYYCGEYPSRKITYRGANELYRRLYVSRA